MRDRVGFKQFAFRWYGRLEFVHEPRLASAGFGNERSDLAMSPASQFKCALELREFLVATDELCQTAPRRKLEMGAQRTETGHFIYVHPLGHALDWAWAEGTQFEIALNQSARFLADRNYTRRAIVCGRAARLIT